MLKPNMTKDKIIYLIFSILLFAGLCIFFIRIHPQTIYDTDDWTYLSFTRSSKLLPSRNEWNPAKVLPENIMPLAGYIGKIFVMPTTGSLFVSETISLSLMLAVFAFAYILLIARMAAVKFRLNVYEHICLACFVALMQFIPYYSSGSGNAHFFYEGNVTCVYNYTIPGLLNIILLCLAVIHEDHIRHFFRKEHVVCKVIYMILIYFAVYSNLFSNIIIAVFAGVKILQYFFIEARDYLTDRTDKLIQCFVYIFTLILWFISMFFELGGGRAQSLSGSSVSIMTAFKWITAEFRNKNLLFNIILILMITAYIALLIHVCRNRSRYIDPLLESLKKKPKKTAEANENDRLCFTCVNQMTFFIICSVLSVIYIILLCAKTGGHQGQPGVQNDYYAYLIISVCMLLAFLMKTQKKSIFGVAAVTLVMAGMIFFGKGTYAEYNMHRHSTETCRQLADYIIDQYIEADKSNVETAQIHVPDYGTGDNFPMADYGCHRIANTLYNYGITKKFVMSEFVKDPEVNKMLGL